MAKKNYNKISTEKAKKEDVAEVVTASYAAVEDETVDIAPTENEPEVIAEVETVTEPLAEPVVETAPELKKGKVYHCTKLNIRKAPKADAEVVGTIDAGVTVVIHDEIGDFYKIGNPDGSEYCMKKFISVK